MYGSEIPAIQKQCQWVSDDWAKNSLILKLTYLFLWKKDNENLPLIIHVSVSVCVERGM
jgi:hypothetical protein